MPDAVSSFGLDELRKILKQLPPARSDEMIAQNLGLISDISRPGTVLGLLDEVLASPAMLASIARLSYHHVNHFDKIVLIDSDAPTGYRLTLHLWQPPYSAEELEDEIIHSHRFSFWSAILTGTLISENFDAADEGLPFRRYSYVPEKKTKVNFYEFGGDAFLSPTGNTEQSASTFYYLPYEQIHRVLLPTEAVTCTRSKGPSRAQPLGRLQHVLPGYGHANGQSHLLVRAAHGEVACAREPGGDWGGAPSPSRRSSAMTSTQSAGSHGLLVTIRHVETLSDDYYVLRRYSLDLQRRDGTSQTITRQVCTRGDSGDGDGGILCI